MARGIQIEHIKYVLKSDEGAPKKEQTIWTLKPVSALDSVASTKRYSKAVQSDIRGKTEISEQNFVKAMRADWLDGVIKVENYMFGYKFPDLQKQGFIANIEDKETIEKILEDLPRDIVNEITDVINQASSVEDLDKKK